MSAEFPYDVFLRATNQADKPRVRRLAERLRAAGLRQNFFGFRFSDFGFPPKAAWVGLERSSVLFRDPANAGRRFIPLLLAECGRSTPAKTACRISTARNAVNATLAGKTVRPPPRKIRNAWPSPFARSRGLHWAEN